MSSNDFKNYVQQNMNTQKKGLKKISKPGGKEHFHVKWKIKKKSSLSVAAYKKKLHFLFSNYDNRKKYK